MPSHAAVPSTLPAPATSIINNPENVIGGTKITAPRSGTITHLAAFVAGNGGGGSANQGGILSIYSHNGGTPGRPLTKLGETAEVFVPRSMPVTGIGPVPLLAPVPVVAGTVYWVCVQTPTVAGQGVWQIRGITAGGDSVFGVAVPAYPTVPTPFPAGGAASTDRASLAIVYDPAATAYDPGAIVGTFVVGDGTLVGQPPVASYNAAEIVLKGKAFVIFVFTDIDVIQLGKPKLTLKGRAFQIVSQSNPVVVMGKSSLILYGKPYFVIVPQFVHLNKSWLTLNAKAYVVQSDSSPEFGKPWLLLKGKSYFAKVPGLVPTIPESIDLVPTVPYPGPGFTFDLVPTDQESLDLVPTIEEFR